MSWEEAMKFAWARHRETGWRWRVYGYVDGRGDGGWRYTAVRAGRRRG